MVFFTCNSCGESLKKAQIEKHLVKCRGCTCLSCIDCGKDFWGEDYKSHVRCISEDQKYGGKGYEAKANKGDVKQQQWIQRIQDAMNKPGINPRLKGVLNQISSYDNIPRKKAKFQNWIQNSLRIYDSRLQDQVWEIFSSAHSTEPNGTQPLNGTQPPESNPDPPLLQEQQQEEEPSEKKKKNKRERKEERQKKKKNKHTENGNAEQEQNGDAVSDERQKKKKKRKREVEECEEGQDEEEKSTKKPKKRKGEEPEEPQDMEDVEEEQEVQDQSNTKGKFNWKGTIKAVLRQAPDEGLSIKKLRKKVLSAYYSFSGDGNYKSEEELYSMFNKKINNPKFKVLKDRVRLVK